MLRVFLLSLFLTLSVSCYSQNISIASWNLKKFGTSKSERSIKAISVILKKFDIIAIQEVVAGPGGPQAVAKLAAELNRSGQAWDYTLSPPTSGSPQSSERYAFIWKKSSVKKVGVAWLDEHYLNEIDREPYYCRFKVQGKVFTLVNYHAVSKSRQPEKEIKYFKFLPSLYLHDKLIFCGDFNLPQSHSVFNPLKRIGYVSALISQKTSLRQKCIDNDCLASEYDNFYYNPASITLISSGVIHFYKKFETLKAARAISDHVPVFLNLSL